MPNTERPSQSVHAPPGAETSDLTPWWRTLNRYHWFVLIVAALGWLFDCLDQQLFNLARIPAMRALLQPGQNVNEFGGYATSIFLIGWATGGLVFGVLGDRIGRAKTMMFTILIYSLCTGLSALSVGFWDFAFYRFVTGLGVGGEFAVGVSLVAEVMPDRARPYALGLLQALSAIGNVSAALISMGLGHLEESGAIGSAWRWMFVIGALPALLAVVIRMRLKEPERWQAARASGKQTGHKLGSYAELFGNPNWAKPAAVAAALVVSVIAVAFFAPGHWPKLSICIGLSLLAIGAGLWTVYGGGGHSRWRHNAMVGVLLACSGVIGLWGIGFFSIDLIRSVLRKSFEDQARTSGEAAKDREFVQLALQWPDAIRNLNVKGADLLSPTAADRDAEALFGAVLGLQAQGGTLSPDATLNYLENVAPQSAEVRQRRSAYLAAVPGLSSAGAESISAHAERIRKRNAEINGKLTYWAGITSMMLNVGAFLGMIAFSRVTQRIGRRPTFAIAFILALLSTAMVFWFLKDFSDVFWMIPIMGFCLLALFGGYAIYFPELFPTHLRSTGTSFCYNVGRFVAASGPAVLGLLTSRVYAHYPEPMRYAGITMCAVFLLGLIVLPFAPETKGQPLPEDESQFAH